MVYRPKDYQKSKLTYQFVTFRMPRDMHARMVKASKEMKLTHAETFRTLVEWGLEMLEPNDKD